MDTPYLPRLHQEMLIIYAEIERICTKHNLTVFTVGGTLLGAVLWTGYIPWDDDLDVAMPRDDYDRFIEICQQELDQKFYLHHTATDPDYWLPFAKIRMNNTVFLEEKRKNVKAHAGIYVDVFPFDYAPDCNGTIDEAKWRMMTWINNHINQRVTGAHRCGNSEKILAPIFHLFSIKALSLYRDKLMRSFDRGERKYYVDLAGGRVLSNSYFPVESILPISDLPFENTTVKVPSDPNNYLLTLYTERYKIIPPKEKQVTHKPLIVRFEDGEEYSYEQN